MAKQHISALTGIRGFAALWVMVHHLVLQYPLKGQSYPWLEQLAERGWLGVDLFFILSGFVISYAHQDDFKQGISFTDWKRFMFLRLIRIYPVHFATTMLLIPVALGAVYLFEYTSPVDAFSLSKLVHSLTLTNGLGIPDSVGWNAPSWSVGSEAFAYLVFPWFTLLLLGRNQPTYINLTLITAILVTTTYIGWDLSDGKRYFGNWPTTLLRISSEFIIGCLLFNICQKTTAKFATTCSIIGAVMIGSLIVVEIPNRWDVLYLIAFALLIYGVSSDEGPVSKLLGTDRCIYLGEISYSVYLCHGIVFMILNQIFSKLITTSILASYGTIALITSTLMFILSTWLVSHLMYHLVERRARSYLKHRFLK